MWQLCIYNIIWHLYNIVILHYAECNIILLHDKKWFCTILKQPIRFQQYLLKKTSLHCCVNIPQNQRIYKSDSYVTSFDQSALRKPNRHIIIYIFSTPYAQLTSTCKNDFVQGRYCHEAIRIRQHLTRPAPPPTKTPPKKLDCTTVWMILHRTKDYIYLIVMWLTNLELGNFEIT